jgi:uncharacterized protein YerC
MKTTAYSALQTEELLEYALLRDNATHMEIELAQRLLLAMQMLEEQDEYPRIESEGSRKAAVN